MTEPTEDTQVPEREITFHDRQIWVKPPKPEQLLVWQRTLKRLQQPGLTWTGESVMAALERLRLIIDSVILNQVDKDWLDDQMLAGNLEMKDTSEIVHLTIDAFGQPTNRAERRTTAKKAAPAKKAVRKTAPSRKMIP
jgi:hypothetical protein